MRQYTEHPGILFMMFAVVATANVMSFFYFTAIFSLWLVLLPQSSTA